MERRHPFDVKARYAISRFRVGGQAGGSKHKLFMHKQYTHTIVLLTVLNCAGLYIESRDSNFEVSA